MEIIRIYLTRLFIVLSLFTLSCTKKCRDDQAINQGEKEPCVFYGVISFWQKSGDHYLQTEVTILELDSTVYPGNKKTIMMDNIVEPTNCGHDGTSGGTSFRIPTGLYHYEAVELGGAEKTWSGAILLEGKYVCKPIRLE